MLSWLEEDCSIPEIKQNMFKNLECLELYRLSDPSFNAMSKTLKLCENTLKCFKLNRYDDYRRAISADPRTLHIPAEIQWLSVIDTSGITMDLSGCKRLLAVQLIEVDVKKYVIGPQRKENMIVFACIGDIEWADGALNVPVPNVDDDGFAAKPKEFKI